MQKYKSNITSTTGAAIRNVPVTVLNEAGELASLFLDRAGAIAAPNPLVTDSSGNFYFYAVNGRYSLRTTVEGVTITDDDVVLLQDPEEITVAGPIAEAVAAAQAAAQQAQEAVDASGIPELVAAAQNAVIDSNQALQEARGASQASAQAKLAAESAQHAAELARGDAQAASSMANTAAQQASAAAHSAAQSAASIDPVAIYQAIGKKVDARPDAGLMTDAERQRLAGVASEATKNAMDSELRDRSTHTGTQSMETVSGLPDALGLRVRQTSATGAAILPEGPPEDRPDPGEEGLYIRLNSTSGKPEWFNRVKAAWQPFGTDGGELFSYAWHNGPRSSIAALTPGCIPADGQQITLLQYPDAVHAVLAGKQNVVTEAVWQADPSKRNCWSLGDGAGWVRVPDLNAVQAGTGKPFYLRGGPDALNGGSVGDAIRNITGTVSNLSIGGGTAGAFDVSAATADTYGLGGTLGSYTRGNFDASRVVPTADENRVKTAYGVMTVRIFSEAANAGSVDAATLATQLAVVDANAQALDAATGFTIIYPNGGSAEAPASVAVNSRYVMSNPFPGCHVLCIAEVQFGGMWGESGWAYSSSAGGGYGVKASQSSTEGIVVRTGSLSVASTGADTGGCFTIAYAITAPTPCRVKVWQLKGAM